MSEPPLVKALGTMSGTSLDGVDAAELFTDGERIAAFGQSGYRPYGDAERDVLRAALGCWTGPAVDEAARIVEQAHLELLSEFSEPEVIGFHGQTLAHDPHGRGTLQAGDGAAISGALGRSVVWDFRSADVAAGGEGAPLAPFYHFACARWIGERGPVAFLNLGGVGNLTLVDPSRDAPDAPGACLAFDTGLANAPIDDLMRARGGQAFDRDGAIAARGRVDERVVAAVLAEPFFASRPPKSLDRADLRDALDAALALPLADAAATLTAVAAEAVATGLALAGTVRPRRMLVTGGGRRNPVLMGMLAKRCGLSVLPVEAVGLDGDMLEAQAFAFLAVRVMRGLPTSCSSTTGARAPVVGGRLSRPSLAA